MKQFSTLLSITALALIISGCSNSITDELPRDSSAPKETTESSTPTPTPTPAPTETAAPSETTDESTTAETVKKVSYIIVYNSETIAESTLEYVDGDLEDRSKIEEVITALQSVKNGEYTIFLNVSDNSTNTNGGTTTAATGDSTTDEVEEEAAPQPMVKKTGVTDVYHEFDDGSYQSGQEREYEINGDVVTDKVTGLLWKDSGQEGTRADASAVCKNLSTSTTAWRVPKAKELATLIKYDTLYPAIDDELKDVLLAGDTRANVWAYEYRYDSQEYAYFANFSSGKIENQINSMQYHIVCVSGVDSTATAKYQERGSYLEDSSHKLMWEDTSDNRVLLSYEAAIKHCESLTLGGYDDWRLPNMSELMTITDYTKSSNLDPAFTYAQRAGVWASTPYAVTPADYAYTALEAYGNVKSRDVTRSQCFRCVRTVK